MRVGAVPRGACSASRSLTQYLTIARPNSNSHPCEISATRHVAPHPLEQPFEMHGLPIPVVKAKDGIRLAEREPTLDIVELSSLHGTRVHMCPVELGRELAQLRRREPVHRTLTEIVGSAMTRRAPLTISPAFRARIRALRSSLEG